MEPGRRRLSMAGPRIEDRREPKEAEEEGYQCSVVIAFHCSMFVIFQLSHSANWGAALGLLAGRSGTTCVKPLRADQRPITGSEKRPKIDHRLGKATKDRPLTRKNDQTSTRNIPPNKT